MLGVVLAVAMPGADVSGAYTGSWSGAAGASGSFKMVVKDGKCEVTFGLGDTEVKTKTTHLELGDSKIEVKYEFDLGGNRLESTVTGKLTDKTLEGTYKTKAVGSGAQVDEGEWKATLQ
ncbi:MAG: hypothetical protein ACRD8O_19485 [Bryobacteraceae bacterium]